MESTMTVIEFCDYVEMMLAKFKRHSNDVDAMNEESTPSVASPEEWMETFGSFIEHRGE